MTEPPNQYPKKVLWLIAGNKENESMVTHTALHCAPFMPPEWQCQNILYTNSKSFGQFPGETHYIHEDQRLHRSLVFKYREIFTAALHDGAIHEADIIISSGMYAATNAALMDFEGVVSHGIKMRRKPIVYLCPKMPEGSNFEVSLDEPLFLIYWWAMSKHPNLWCVTFDSDYELELADKFLAAAAPQASNKRIKRMINYQWPGHFTELPKKEDLVVWQGRSNSNKRPDLAFQILTLLAGRGFKVEAFVPNLGEVLTPKTIMAAKKLFPVHQNLERQDYIKTAARAKVSLQASQWEGWPPGYFELIERACIPVIRRQHWMRTFLTDEWPLVWTNMGEAVEMCIDALNNYEYYKDILAKCLAERYSDPVNWSALMRDVWARYLVGDVYEFSLGEKPRPDRKSKGD